MEEPGLLVRNKVKLTLTLYASEKALQRVKEIAVNVAGPDQRRAHTVHLNVPDNLTLVVGDNISQPDGTFVSWTHTYSEFGGSAVNGFWHIALKENLIEFLQERGVTAPVHSVFLHSWSITVPEVDYYSPIEHFGSVCSLVGDGTWKRGNPEPSQSGQSRTKSMGGRSWGVAQDLEGRILYTIFDQNVLARLEKDNTVTHLVENEDGHLDMPMTLDVCPRDGIIYVCSYGSSAIISYDPKTKRVRSHLGKVLNHPSACRFSRWPPLKDYLLVCDSGKHRILAYHPKTKKTMVLINSKGQQGLAHDDQPVGDTPLNFPTDMDISPGGVLAIADGLNHRIVLANLSETVQFALGQCILPGAIKMGAGSSTPRTGAAESLFDTGDLTSSESSESSPPSSAAASALATPLLWPFAPRWIEDGRTLLYIDADRHRISYISECGLNYRVGGQANPKLGFTSIDGTHVPSLVNNAQNATFNRPMDLWPIKMSEAAAASTPSYNLLVGDTDHARVRMITGFVPSRSVSKDKCAAAAAAHLSVVNTRNPLFLEEKGRLFFGMESWTKNTGEMSAPGDAFGCLSLSFVLRERKTGRAVRSGSKPAVYLSSFPEHQDKSYGSAAKSKPFPVWTSTVPGGTDVYPNRWNASRLDITGLSPGAYTYELWLDMSGTYRFHRPEYTPQVHATHLYLDPGQKIARRL